MAVERAAAISTLRRSAAADGTNLTRERGGKGEGVCQGLPCFFTGGNWGERERQSAMG